MLWMEKIFWDIKNSTTENFNGLLHFSWPSMFFKKKLLFYFFILFSSLPTNIVYLTRQKYSRSSNSKLFSFFSYFFFQSFFPKQFFLCCHIFFDTPELSWGYGGEKNHPQQMITCEETFFYNNFNEKFIYKLKSFWKFFLSAACWKSNFTVIIWSIKITFSYYRNILIIEYALR